jgi:hypothetical protein
MPPTAGISGALVSGVVGVGVAGVVESPGGVALGVPPTPGVVGVGNGTVGVVTVGVPPMDGVPPAPGGVTTGCVGGVLGAPGVAFGMGVVGPAAGTGVEVEVGGRVLPVVESDALRLLRGASFVCASSELAHAGPRSASPTKADQRAELEITERRKFIRVLMSITSGNKGRPHGSLITK